MTEIYIETLWYNLQIRIRAQINNTQPQILSLIIERVEKKF